jgi:pimeloyl-ACP methyl ester carboxylesterase
MPIRLASKLEFKPDDLYRVPTDDGSAIALGRYHPRGNRRYVEPVILAHSLGTNRFNLDFDERYSVARALARRGFETWVLELRGHGLAGSPHLSTFDIEAEFDVRSAIRAVTSTGVPSVLWVGHSRGGLLAYAHLARNPLAPIRAIVAMASPLSFESSPGLKAFVGLISPSLKLDSIPLVWPARAALPIGVPPNPIGKYLLRAENTDAHVVRQALSQVVANIPGGVARQFARWVSTGQFDGEDGLDYRKAMKAIHAPILTIAGAADFMAPPAASHLVSGLVHALTESVTVGVHQGYSADYGHGDLVLGRRAPDEIIPRLVEFLARHATPAA